MTTHPHLYISFEDRGIGQSVEELRESVRSGLPSRIWNGILERCDREFGAKPLLASSTIPGRPGILAEEQIVDFVICNAAGNRMMRHALALLITEDERHKGPALEQIEALIDPERWPDWISQSHQHFGYPADLRTGMLSQSIGITYDWLHPFLSGAERELILEGIERRGIRPYRESLRMDPWWLGDLHNWLTVIVGGLGIAGMGLGTDHPEAQELIDFAVPRMKGFLETYGKEGEFNECVGYSNANRIPVDFFHALRCHEGGDGPDYLANWPFPQIAEWTMRVTLPSGHLAVFGDAHADRGPETAFLAAIAAATRNPVYQGFALKHMKAGDDPLELLYLDPDLESREPAGVLSLGKAYRDNSAEVVSRSSWEDARTAMVVYGKAKRDRNHDHHDLGQLCIDGFGERLIIDMGYPPTTPPNFFEKERWFYYNASVEGHNILQFGGRQQRSHDLERGIREGFDFESVNGRYLQTDFDENRGGAWQIDLTRAYDGVKRVRRSVIHLLPGFVACLDEAKLQAPEPIRLRWNCISPPETGPDGGFLVKGEQSTLSCRAVALDGQPVKLESKRHAYEAPYDLDVHGRPMAQRYEPYLEIAKTGERCRWLTLFAVFENGTEVVPWTGGKGEWSLAHPEFGPCRVKVTESKLFHGGNAGEIHLELFEI